MIDALPILSNYTPWAISLVALWLSFGVGRFMREGAAVRRRRKALERGASTPVSLHPLIDPARCVGCGACAHACPEGKIIGLIGGKAQLLDPQSCIGHGACKTACPASAIDLVFGTAQRGVDIPLVSPDFESSVPGVFIAGELGGMGLIANAIEQGRQAIAAVARLDGLRDQKRYDVVVVGGGPAGIAASLAAKELKLTCLTLEQDTLGGTVARYPRGKLVMTRPAELPLYGKVRLRRVRKERLLTLWQSVIRKTGVKIHHQVRVERLVPMQIGFQIVTSSGSVEARAVVLATGRRGTPRRLGVPGEALSKVSYDLGDPQRFQGRSVLVAGGGDSALEAVVALLKQNVRSVTLVVRGRNLSRAKSAVQDRLQLAQRDRRLQLLFSSAVISISPDHVVLDCDGQHVTLQNDAVIVCIGGELPLALLNGIGIAVETRYGTA